MNHMTDGYKRQTDGYTDGYYAMQFLNNLAKDGYVLNNKQINIKLTEDDVNDVNLINQAFFEGEVSNSTIGRILLRKGIAFYKKLMDQ